MPSLSIIPARAVMDRSLTPTQLRVLCAVGIHTNRLGGGVWTSVNTLADEAGVSRSTVQRACRELEASGYLRCLERPGRTNLYEVVLDEPMTQVTGDTGRTGEAPPRSQLCGPTPVIAVTPERPKRTSPKNEYGEAEREIVNHIWRVYPKRPEPHSYPAALKAIVPLLRQGVDGGRLLRSAERYAAHCGLNKTEPQYVKSMPRFFADDFWKAYDVVLVHGRTREEWARSGQDVSKFDSLAATITQRSA